MVVKLDTISGIEKHANRDVYFKCSGISRNIILSQNHKGWTLEFRPFYSSVEPVSNVPIPDIKLLKLQNSPNVLIPKNSLRRCIEGQWVLKYGKWYKQSGEDYTFGIGYKQELGINDYPVQLKHLIHNNILTATKIYIQTLLLLEIKMIPVKTYIEAVFNCNTSNNIFLPQIPFPKIDKLRFFINNYRDVVDNNSLIHLITYKGENFMCHKLPYKLTFSQPKKKLINWFFITQDNVTFVGKKRY